MEEDDKTVPRGAHEVDEDTQDVATVVRAEKGEVDVSVSVVLWYSQRYLGLSNLLGVLPDHCRVGYSPVRQSGSKEPVRQSLHLFLCVPHLSYLKYDPGVL